jgi:DNA end-binding protein Ku
VAALGNRQRVGLAHWVMRKKAYAGALFARRSHLMLMTLRHAEEVLELPEARPSKSYQAGRKEVALAEQLVSALEDVFDPETYHDAYRERVLQLIEHKAKGEQVPSHRVEKKPPARALDAVLRDSVRLARERRSA